MDASTQLVTLNQFAPVVFNCIVNDSHTPVVQLQVAHLSAFRGLERAMQALNSTRLASSRQCSTSGRNRIAQMPTCRTVAVRAAVEEPVRINTCGDNPF